MSSMIPHAINKAILKSRGSVNGQIRNMSLLDKMVIRWSASEQLTKDLESAIAMVRQYDPVGYLPGLLIATNIGKIGYFATRAFWVQSGLRFEPIKVDTYDRQQVSGTGQKSAESDPMERILRLKDAVESLYNSNNLGAAWERDGNLRLIHFIMQNTTISKRFLDRIIEAREHDLNVKQYATMQSLVEHTELSCGSLLHLALQSAGVDQSDSEHVIYKAACEIGRAHGLTNALRTSIPVASSGKIIIPADLCTKYGVQSPRYLLSALGQGDEECRGHLKSAVRDLALTAREHLKNARLLRDSISVCTHGDRALSALIAGVASETFLNRLENHDFDLTNKNLRQVGLIEHAICSGRILLASKNRTF